MTWTDFLKSSSEPKNRIFTRVIPCAFFLVLASLFLIKLLLLTDPDYFWRLKHGEMILQEGRFPMREIFSFTAQGTRMISNAWLSEVILYKVHVLFGYFGQAVFQTLLLTLTHALLYLFLIKRAGLSPIGGILLTGLCGLNFLAVSTPRAQNFSFLFFMLSLFAVADWEEGSEKSPYFIALWTLVWVNFHSGFMLALVLLFLIGLGQTIADRRLRFTAWAPLLAGLLLSCVNPEGYLIFYFPAHAFLNAMIREWIVEMRPINLSDASIFLPYFTLLILLVVYGIKSLSSRRFPWFLLCGVLLYQSLTAQRMAPFFALVGLICLAFSLRTMEHSTGTGWMYAGVALFTTGMMFFKYFYPQIKTVFPWTESKMHRTYPRESVELIRQKYPGKNIFNFFNWGGYLIYYLPANRIAVDSRTEPYLEFIQQIYLPVINGSPRIPLILNQIQADLVLIPPDWPLCQTLTEQKDWEMVLRTDRECLFARKGGGLKTE